MSVKLLVTWGKLLVTGEEILTIFQLFLQEPHWALTGRMGKIQKHWLWEGSGSHCWKLHRDLPSLHNKGGCIARGHPTGLSLSVLPRRKKALIYREVLFKDLNWKYWRLFSVARERNRKGRIKVLPLEEGQKQWRRQYLESLAVHRQETETSEN